MQRAEAEPKGITVMQGYILGPKKLKMSRCLGSKWRTEWARKRILAEVCREGGEGRGILVDRGCLLAEVGRSVLLEVSPKL